MIYYSIATYVHIARLTSRVSTQQILAALVIQEDQEAETESGKPPLQPVVVCVCVRVCACMCVCDIIIHC